MNATETPYRATYVNESARVRLASPPSALVGVTTEAEAELAALGIRNVFDLGTSSVFANARFAVGSSQVGTVTERMRLFPSELLRPEATWATLQDIARLPVEELRAIQRGSEVRRALGVETIGDLAAWPPYLTARRLIGDVAGSTIDPEELEAERLRPKLGEYPTERVYYSTLVLLKTDEERNGVAVEAPIPLAPLASGGVGFGRPAVGALVTLSQSWYAQGITLGHLLHSLALAPGESTRVAVIDWARKSQAMTSEVIEETEALDVAATHARAVSEVQAAVASDLQTGGSMSAVNASSASKSFAASGGSSWLASVFGADSQWARTEQSAESSAVAASSSWSSGNRSIMADLAQTVNDRTEQHAASVRNRRASAIREVSQTEHQEVSTRIVANYNHMHALTIQYFEVVQVFRVSTELQRADRCLFIPIQLCRFEGQAGVDLIQRFRWPLVRAALSNRVLQLLLDDITIGGQVSDVALRAEAGGLTRSARLGLVDRLRTAAGGSPRRGMTKGSARSKGGKVVLATEQTGQRGVLETEVPTEWDAGDIARVSRLFPRSIVRLEADDPHFPVNVELVALSIDGLSVTEVRIDRSGGRVIPSFDRPTGYVTLPQAVRFDELDAIALAHDRQVPDTGSIQLHCRYLGTDFTLPPVAVVLRSQAMQRILTFTNNRNALQGELLTHLKANTSHYSSAIYRSLDATAITMLMSQYTWNGKPINDQVEPKPVSVIGNYVVLRAPIERDEVSGVGDGERELSWGELLDRRQIKLGTRDERLVPIPSDGIFAEAVLGRSNAAEKLDISRFWNWQDSPIPLTAPEIAPVGTESRATPEELKPGALGQPVLNIVNPTTLPDPTSITAILTALSSGSMFRDMSGLAGTQQLAQKGMSGTLEAATQAGKLASENLRTEAQRAVAMAQTAADLVKSLYGGGGGSSKKGVGSNTLSAEGARINKGRELDERGTAPTLTPRTRTANVEGSPATGGKTDGVSGGGSSGDPGGEYSREVAAFDTGTFGASADATRHMISEFAPPKVASSGGSDAMATPDEPPAMAALRAAYWETPECASKYTKDLTEAEAHALLMHYYVHGKILLTRTPAFDKAGALRSPKPGELVRIRTVVAGVPLTVDPVLLEDYYREKKRKGYKGSLEDLERGFESATTQTRMAVLLVRFAEYLQEQHGVKQIFYGGLSGGGQSHVQRRAMDFFAVNVADRTFDVKDHWGDQPVTLNGKMLERWPPTCRTTTFRLDPQSREGEFFKAVYDFLSFHAKNLVPADTVGDMSRGGYIVHPDHPEPKLRKSHQNHIHFELPERAPM